MKKVIIDSNIVFSALRGKSSLTRDKILNSQDKYYAPNLLIGEIFKHKERMLKKSKASEEETLESVGKSRDDAIRISDRNGCLFIR